MKPPAHIAPKESLELADWLRAVAETIDGFAAELRECSIAVAEVDETVVTTGSRSYRHTVSRDRSTPLLGTVEIVIEDLMPRDPGQILSQPWSSRVSIAPLHASEEVMPDPEDPVRTIRAALEMVARHVDHHSTEQGYGESKRSDDLVHDLARTVCSAAFAHGVVPSGYSSFSLHDGWRNGQPAFFMYSSGHDAIVPVDGLDRAMGALDLIPCTSASETPSGFEAKITSRDAYVLRPDVETMNPVEIARMLRSEVGRHLSFPDAPR